MLLSEILNQLAQGELSTLAGEYDDQEDGALDYGANDTVIPHIQLGLTALHARFPLQTGQVTIQQFEAVSEYFIHPALGASQNGDVVDASHYIVDTVARPYPNNIIRIEYVKDELGETLPLNKPSDPTSLLMPQFNALTVPFPSDNVTMVVHYRANHVELINDDLDPTTTIVTLPQAYLRALLMFVAARVHASVPSLEGTNNGAAYEAKYERACFDLENQGIQHKEQAPEIKFQSRGFV